MFGRPSLLSAFAPSAGQHPPRKGALWGRVTVGHVQTCPRSIFSAISAIVSFNSVLVNEYECVDPVHPLHKATNNFPTRLTDCHFIIRML